VTLLVSDERALPGGEAGEDEPSLHFVVCGLAELFLQQFDFLGDRVQIDIRKGAVSGIYSELSEALSHIRDLVQGAVGVREPGDGIVQVLYVLPVLHEGGVYRKFAHHADRVVRGTLVELARGHLPLKVQHASQVFVHIRKKDLLHHGVGYAVHCDPLPQKR